MFQRLIRYIFPNKCLKCSKILDGNSAICSDCFNKMDFITYPNCLICGRPFEFDNGAKTICPTCMQDKRPIIKYNRSCFDYSANIKSLIFAFKFYDRTNLAKIFAKWMINSGEDYFKKTKRKIKTPDIIIPVPLHWTRLITRKYNQSALLANEISKLTNIPAKHKILKRNRRTKPQVNFNGKARVKNVRNAFEVRGETDIDIKGKTILLIDDVYTTGSTLKECAKALKQKGAENIYSLTIAKVIK